MTRDEFHDLMRDQFERLVAISASKGADYSVNDDALSNFKYDSERISKIAESNPDLLKWYVYFDKHYTAVMTFLEEGDVKSEPIEGRIDDCLLYLFILKGLLSDRRLRDLEAKL